jgi:biopolymer transport protein ExbD
MQLRRKPSEQAEVAAESMNDIMFFLMLFFLIISTLANPNVVKLALPSATASKQMNKQPVVVSVALKEDGKTPQYYIAKEPVTIEQLEEHLREDIKKAEDATIVLRMDKALTVKDLKEVLMVGQKLKIKMVMASASAGS